MDVRVVNKTELGRRLRYRRKQLGHQQKTVAAAINMPVSTLCEWEAAAMPNALLQLGKLALFLDCTPDDLLLEGAVHGHVHRKAADLPPAALGAVYQIMDDLVKIYRLTESDKNFLPAYARHLRWLSDTLAGAKQKNNAKRTT
jgi:transcriptional regulator with XRE-family HTH domain